MTTKTYVAISIHERIGDSADYNPSIVDRCEAEHHLVAFTHFLTNSQKFRKAIFDDIDVYDDTVAYCCCNIFPEVKPEWFPENEEPTIDDVVNALRDRYTDKELYDYMFNATNSFDGFIVCEEDHQLVKILVSKKVLT